MSYNKDELEAPEWVNDDFMKTVIESSGEGENVKILNCKISPATALGDHFASIMFRINITFLTKELQNKSISLIVKTLPVEDGLKKELLSHTKMDLFRFEVFMYTNVLNECKSTLNLCGYNELLAPRLLYHSLEPRKVLVFEDLKEKGYIMLPHNVPNEHEVKLIYSKLAQFHATTFKMGQDGRKDLSHLKGTTFGFSFIKQFDAVKHGPALFTGLLESLPGFEGYARKMRHITFELLWEKCCQTVELPGPYTVLNHGDYHIRNMMFKKNIFDVISEVILIDFQCPHWGSPAYDLVYMSAPIPWKLRQIGFRHYFNIFTDVVVKMGYNGKLPVYEELEKHLDDFVYMDLFFVVCFSVILYIDRTNTEVDFEELLSNASALARFYYNPDYVSHVKEVTPKLLDIICIEEEK